MTVLALLDGGLCRLGHRLWEVGRRVRDFRRRANWKYSHDAVSEWEAEAALLALGDGFAWMRYEYDEYAEEEARTDAGDYLIKMRTGGRYCPASIAVYHGKKRDFALVTCLPAYMQPRHAKAACEHHYMRGRWE